MSIASEYAARVKAAEQTPKDFARSGYEPMAWVTKDGGMFCKGSMSGEEALEFAEWILTTFGEKK